MIGRTHPARGESELGGNLRGGALPELRRPDDLALAWGEPQTRAMARMREIGLQFWSPADFACHETRVALSLGDLGLAERSARTALATADESRFPRNHAIYSVRLGDVLAKAGKLDEAIAVTSNAVKRADQLAGSRRITRDLTGVVDALATRDYQPAKSFARAARQWVAAP